MQLGTYQHFRNKQLYRVIGVAFHSETKEEMVVYQALYESGNIPFGQLWVRPKQMFLEEVEFEGKKVLRFALVAE